MFAFLVCWMLSIHSILPNSSIWESRTNAFIGTVHISFSKSSSGTEHMYNGCRLGVKRDPNWGACPSLRITGLNAIDKGDHWRDTLGEYQLRLNQLRARITHGHAQLKILASLLVCSPSRSKARRTAANDSERGKISRLTSRSASSAPTGCQYTPSAVMVTSGTRSARATATPSVAAPRNAIRRMTRSS